jgi:hypothetical protein
MSGTANFRGELVPLSPHVTLPLQVGNDRLDVLPDGSAGIFYRTAIHAYASDEGFCLALADGDDRPKPLSRRRALDGVPCVKIIEEPLWDRNGAMHQLRTLRIGPGHLRKKFV